MKIDSCINTFLESYDREAIASIDKISHEYGLVIHENTIKLFNLKESFDTFRDCLNLYTKYQIENANNDKKLPHDKTYGNTMEFIEGKIFADADVKYKDLVGFVQGYTEGVNLILEAIEANKESIMEAGIDPVYSADINDFTDKFVDIMNTRFTESMNKILRASGYSTHKALHNPVKKNKPIFV